LGSPPRRISVAAKAHNRELREQAKRALKFPAVRFNGLQARAIGQAIGETACKGNYVIWACSILPEHVHLVLGRHTFKVEQIINLMKGTATRTLLTEQLHPFQDLQDEKGRVPKCRARKEWKVFLNSAEDILRAIQYVQYNPVKEGKHGQKWRFVIPFTGV
jgi:REP element-mobilizing transposase RayT